MKNNIFIIAILGIVATAGVCYGQYGTSRSTGSDPSSPMERDASRSEETGASYEGRNDSSTNAYQGTRSSDKESDRWSNSMNSVR